MSNVTEEELTV